MTTESKPLIIEPDQLEPILDDDNLLIIDLCQPSVYDKIHIPGAVHVAPAELVAGTPPATGKLPAMSKLEQLFSRIGYTRQKYIVAYDDEGGGWAGRFLWTLDVIGHHNYSLLNGGLHAWINEGHPVQAQSVVPEPTDCASLSIDNSVIASLDEVTAQLSDDNSIIWDARSAEEFHGLRGGALRSGHIPGAVNLDWLEVMDTNSNYRLFPLDLLRQKLQSLGITQDKKIITHCHTHHRSGLTYIIGKALGLNIRAYDGSWSEWGNLDDTPIET